MKNKKKANNHFLINAPFYFELLLVMKETEQDFSIDFNKSIKCVGAALFEKNQKSYFARTKELYKLVNSYLKKANHFNPTKTLKQNLEIYKHCDKYFLFAQTNEVFNNEAKLHQNHLKWYQIHQNKIKE